MSLTFDEPFVGGDFLQGHWAARPKLLSTDAYFGAKTELCTVGKAGRSIPIDAGCIHLCLEKACLPLVAGDDTLTVAASVLADMVDGSLQRGHGLDGHSVIHILGSKAVVRRMEEQVVGLWENYPVQQVATHEGWEADPVLVTNFYNMLRRKCVGVKPNEGHRLVAKLEEQYEVTVVTQNVDNLHEVAGSSHVIHLHGELMKVCSSRDVENRRYWKTLTPDDCEVVPGTKAGDGSLLRPYIVFFGEAVPNITVAAEEVQEADILVIIGTSLVVYPAAGLLHYARPGIPIYLIDPNPISAGTRVTQIQKGASEGMKELLEILQK